MASNILYINYSLETGGIEKLIYDITQRINPQLYKPEILVFRPGGTLPERLQQKGIPYHCINKKEGIDLSLVPKIVKIVKERKIKILHTNNYDSWFYGALSAKMSRGVRHIHTEHSNIAGLIRRTLENVLIRITDEVVAVSNPVRKGMMQCWTNQDAARVIYNGVDCSRFRPDAGLREKIRNKYEIGADVFLVGIVARLVHVKNHKCLFKAVSLLQQQKHNIHLLVVGDGELREELEEEVRVLGIGGLVSFLGEKSSIHEILAALDVFVLSSFSEGLSLTLLEAMSSGLPIVATNVGGNPEIVIDGETGFLVPSNEPGPLAGALEKLFSDNKLYAAISGNARKRALQHFSIEKWVHNYEQLYFQCAAH